MKIQKMELENFRSFKGKHTIEFAPINLFFGANGVGKSSLFKALANFNHLTEKDIYNGESFASVSLTFTANTVDKPEPLLKGNNLFKRKELPALQLLEQDLLKTINEIDWAEDFIKHFQLHSKTFFIKHGIKIQEHENESYLAGYRQYGTDGIWLYETEFAEEHYYSDWEQHKICININHPIFEDHYFLKSEPSKKSFELLNTCFNRLEGQDRGYATHHLEKCITLHIKDFLGKELEQNNIELRKDLNRMTNLLEGYLVDTTDDNYKRLHKCLPVLVSILRCISRGMPDLEELAHLGPLRKIPERVEEETPQVTSSNSNSAYLYSSRNVETIERKSANYTGGAAWQDIFQSFTFGQDYEPFSWEEKGPSLVDRVNAWLLNGFNSPYEIQFHREFVFKADSPEKLKKLNMGELRKDDLAAKGADVLFRNVQNGSVSPASEIGVGISQLTPVIVNAIASKSFFVEQPELHIHPRMQTVLGDLFIFEGLFNQVEHSGEVTITTRMIDGETLELHYNRKSEDNESFILLETHSEHLILRLLKRLREEVIKPEDLAIYYFENDQGKTVTNNIGVDSDGEFTSPWPEGFFEERLEELF